MPIPQLRVIEGGGGEAQRVARARPLLVTHEWPLVALIAADLRIRGSFIRVSEMYTAALAEGYALIKDADAALEFAKRVSRHKLGQVVLVATEPILNGDTVDEPGYHIKAAIGGKESIALVLPDRHYSPEVIYVFRASAER